MGWFDEQIREKIKNERESFSDAWMEMTGAVTGNAGGSFWGWDDRAAAIRAVSEILNFYHVKPQEIPDSIEEMQDILEYLMRPSGFMRRRVKLSKDWYRNGIGAMLGVYQKSKRAVAILPVRGGYEAADEETGKKIRISADNASMFSEEAICFYRPLPLKAIGMKELAAYLVQATDASDFAAMLAAGMFLSLLGLLTPLIHQLIFSNVLKTGNIRELWACGILLTGTAVSSSLITSVRQLTFEKIRTKLNAAVSSAFLMRLLSLPAAFFKNYGAGELVGRIQDVNGMCDQMAYFFLTVVLSAVCSVVYLVQIASYTPALLFPAFAVMAFALLGPALFAFLGRKRAEEKMELLAKESGLVFSVFSGIQKIKLAGAERRVFVKWAKQYGQIARLKYAPPFFLKVNSVFLTVISLMGTIFICGKAIRSGVSAADYMAFAAAYAMLSGSVFLLSASISILPEIWAAFSVIRPVLKEAPEVSREKKIVTGLSGGIELNHVSFRYTEDMPLILDNISIKIQPGEYVAIVGKTGCGKSTLMRLLLGFEQPMKGAVYFDGKDISQLDLKSLRSFMGVVMQNGKMFQGDIYSNITISSPNASMEQAWEAARIAGIAEDIQRMPMGMHTIVPERGRGFSGGQKQRIFIARAVASKPKVLLFDEATSALDNVTQKQVSDALSRMKCTRVVIAHRLSTVLQCDRILVLDQGRIVEEGTYQELIEADGFFAELVQRQRIDTGI